MKFSHEDAPALDPDHTPDQDDPKAVLEHIAQILGVPDAEDYDALQDALQQAIAAVAGDKEHERVAASRLTDGEKRAAREAGITALQFTESKRARALTKDVTSIRRAFGRR